MTNAPSNRFLFELVPGDPRIAMVLPGGQSEHPDSPFHNSMLRDYLDGRYADVPWLDQEVEAAAVESYTLRR